jgi:hypothetical protein
MLTSTFAASFVFIFLRAFQQRNVAFDNYLAIVPTSLLMAATEVIVIANIASRGWHLPLVLAVGFGSGLGAIVAVLTHKRLFRRK